MDKGRLHSFLRRFADIRPAETRPALLLFLYFFLITLVFYMIKPVKETYQISINERWWGVFDLATAALIGFVVAINARLLNRLPRRTYSARTLLFFIASALPFWLIFHLMSPNTRTFIIPPLLVFCKNIDYWIYFALGFSLWSDVFIVMSVTQFWISVNDTFNLHQAKRLVGFLVTGGLLGGIAGSLMTLVLVPVIGRANLLLVCAAGLTLTMVIVNRVHSEREKIRAGEPAEQVRAGPGVGYLESLQTVRRDRYLRILAGVFASAAIVGQLINFQFKFVVKAQEWGDSARASFIAAFFLGILVLSTVFHLATTGQILKKFGIRQALFLAPVVLFLGSLSVFALTAAAMTTLAGRAWACGLRGADKTFDNTINQSLRELLYIPLRADIKYKAKIFIDMFVSKFALGFGAVIYWIIYRASSFAGKTYYAIVKELGIFVAGFALVWVFLIVIIFAEYLGTVMKDLKIKWENAHRIVKEHMNVDAARLIVDTLQSQEKSATLFAMNIFQLVQREELTPELMDVLGFKEDELKARSVGSLLEIGGEFFYPGIREDLADKDFGTEIGLIISDENYKAVMGKRLSDIVENRMESEVVRTEAAKLLGLIEPTPVFMDVLGRLLRDPSPEVLNYALASAAVHRRKEHVPLILPLLGSPVTQRLAQDTLAAYGARIGDILRDRLQDPGETLEVRKAIPEVLARLADQKAADILAEELACGRDELEPDLIEALSKIRAEQPQIRFKEKKVEAALLSLIRQNYAEVLAAPGNQAASASPVRTPDMKAVLDLRTKRIFDLLTLIYSPPENIVKAYQNILQGTPKSVDHSLELLDNILDRKLKTYLFPLIEDLPPDERLRRMKKLMRGLEAGLR